MAPQEGFEPPTPAFVAQYSSPLSYWGMNFKVALHYTVDTPFRDVTVANLPAGRDSNYLTFGTPSRIRTSGILLAGDKRIELLNPESKSDVIPFN